MNVMEFVLDSKTFTESNSITTYLLMVLNTFSRVKECSKPKSKTTISLTVELEPHQDSDSMDGKKLPLFI